MLDQKVWLNVKYSVNSDRIALLGNHSMSVVTDNESYEKVLIFGGISNKIGTSVEDIRSALSNKPFLITLTARSAGKTLFKEPAESNIVKGYRNSHQGQKDNGGSR